MRRHCLLFVLGCLLPALSNAVPSPHGEMRFGMGAGVDRYGKSFLAPGFRLGLHDFLDRSTSFPLHTQFEIFSLGLRWKSEQKQLSVDEMILLRVLSQPPYASDSVERSWKVELGAERIWDRRCDDCLAAKGVGGLGITFAPVPGAAMWLSTFADLELSAGGFSGSSFAPGVGPSAQLRIEITPSLKAVVDGFYRYFFFVDYPKTYGGSAALRWTLTPFFALQGAWKLDTDHSQLTSTLFFYF